MCSNCSAWHWIIHLLLFLLFSHRWCYTVSFLPRPPNFLSIHHSLSLTSTFFHPPLLPLSCFSSPLPHSAPFSSSSHSSPISQPTISLTTPFLLYVSALYLSPVLSALRRFSAITPFHLLIPVLIQPSTHSCLASKYTTLANIHARTPTCTSADCTNVPRGAWCVHALTPRLLCRKMPFVKGQGASISQLHQSALWCSSLPFNCFVLLLSLHNRYWLPSLSPPLTYLNQFFELRPICRFCVVINAN